MAKPKHPTLKSLRQGQTVYMISDDSYAYREPAGTRLSVIKYFIHSHNTPDPDPNCIIEKLPVTHLKEYVKSGHVSLSWFYYSRRRAEGAMS